MEKGKFFHFLIRRLIWMFVAFIAIATIIFISFRQIGDPIAIFVMPELGAAAVAQIKAAFGLDKPIYIQYLLYLKSIFTLDFGYSFAYLEPAAPILLDCLANSLMLMIPSLLAAYILGIFFGVVLAWKRGVKESFIMVFALVIRSTPVFWTGLILISLFAVLLNLLPVGGMMAIGTTYANKLELFFSWDFVRHAVLPFLSMTFYFMGMPLLLMRTSMLEVLHEDFVELCTAKGLRERDIMYKHVARNAILPVVTLFSLAMTWAFGGNALIEYVFSWPGIGGLMVDSVLRNDYPIAQFSFLIMAGTVLIMNFVADMLYGVLDPRIEYK